ncbi:MAG: RluA family pseudouridine synthase [Defluviitaleaceae bacterium]|nr:RluA family pseudouridine synthase [Defluviitaleaceae bacterium]
MSLVLTYQICLKNHHQSLGNFLKQQALSKKAISVLKHQSGKIDVNGKVQTTRFILHVGDVVTVTFPEESVSHALVPIQLDLAIIYEDDFLLVVDKQAGLPVMPTGQHGTSLANGILAYYETIGLKSTVHFVNRLDKDTSGLLLIAKYRQLHHLLTMDNKHLKRKYYALVSGILQQSGRINAPIIRPSADSIKRTIHPDGKFAITHYEVVENFTSETLVRCRLETGRTHQIRVHMRHLGHHILKDPLYGDGVAGDQQLLHSYLLEFVHPMTGETLRFETDVPSRFEINQVAT